MTAEWPQLKAIDPEGCGCTDCLTGYSVPLECMTRHRWALWAAGLMADRTPLSRGELVHLCLRATS